MRTGMRRSKGQAIVEFALVLPVLLLLVMGIIDFGSLYDQYLLLAHAAREGARTAAIGGSAWDVETRVNALVAVRWAPGQVAVDVSEGVVGGVVEETVTLNAPGVFLTPLPGMIGLGASIPLTATASFRKE